LALGRGDWSVSAPAALTPVSLVRRLGEPQNRSGCGEKGKKARHLSGIEPRSSST